MRTTPLQYPTPTPAPEPPRQRKGGWAPWVFFASLALLLVLGYVQVASNRARDNNDDGPRVEKRNHSKPWYKRIEFESS